MGWINSENALSAAQQLLKDLSEAKNSTYLINEQHGSSDTRPNYASSKPKFFTASNQLIVVWKEHLVQ